MDSRTARSAFAVNGQKSPQIRFGDALAPAKAVGDQLAGGDPAPNRAGANAEHFRRLGDGEELDSVAPIIATAAFQTTSFCAAATRAVSPCRHYPPSSELAAATCRATNALMLATVIFRERPSL
jgi:hypothetical protein